MAIQTRIINNYYTEIYAGGNFITQSAPTNFHQFWTQKILTPGESIEDFKEVTASEKTALEKSDAKWEKPSDWEIAQWEMYATISNKKYGMYNRDTGYAELNGIIDIGLDEMRTILAAAPMTRLFSDSNFCMSMYYFNNRNLDSCRTCMPIYHNNRGGATGNTIFFSYAVNFEVLQFCANNYISIRRAFVNCKRLRKILGFNGSCGSSADALSNAFVGCVALETAEVRNLWHDVSFADSPLLSKDSVETMVRHRRADGKFASYHFTITLHPQAYARVTDEIFALAAEKNITIAST